MEISISDTIIVVVNKVYICEKHHQGYLETVKLHTSVQVLQLQAHHHF